MLPFFIQNHVCGRRWWWLYIDEDAFMQAISSLKIDLTDDETYLLANVLFPHAASKINYKDFLDSTFNTTAA